MFLTSPAEGASLRQWKDHLNNLLVEDQRQPFIAMAVRRARQHIAKIEAAELLALQRNPHRK